MSERAVPWASGRRALVYERATGQWVSAVGVGPDEELPDGARPGWESWFRETDEEPGLERGRGWECLWHHETQTRLLPGQCPRCYEVHEEHAVYGLFPGGDPRDFAPDAECNTPDEIQRHKAACEAWERGDGVDRGPSCMTFGDASAYTGKGFGLGTTTYRTAHTPDCPVPAREAAGVPQWLAPFVREAPPPLACQKSYQVYQVYHRGMEQMFSADGVAWHTEAGEPFEPTALGWVCIDDDGPTVAPWGEP